MPNVSSKDGTSIGFQVVGTGRPLLFVHGTTADHLSWRGVTPYLEKHYSVYAMDRRGRGLSGDADNYELMREAEDVVAVLEAIEAPAYLFGHSYGGLCSLEAARLTDKISRLILYEPAIPVAGFEVPNEITNRLAKLVTRGELETAMEYFLREVAKLPEHELEAYRQSPLWPQRIAHAATLLREMEVERTYQFEAEKYVELDVPTMLLLGGDSPAQYQKAVEVVADTLPNSRVVFLPGQQHMAHHAAPEMLARAIMEFLKE